jgi:hypothetical protein
VGPNKQTRPSQPRSGAAGFADNFAAFLFFSLISLPFSSFHFKFAPFLLLSLIFSSISLFFSNYHYFYLEFRLLSLLFSPFRFIFLLFLFFIIFSII